MIYNVNKIENWYDDFISCKNKFANTYFDDYQDSYVRSCSDDIIRKMRTQLDNHYNKIKRIYDRVYNHWNSYLNDLKNIDNCLAGTARSSSINASSAASKLNALPELKVYEADLVTKIESFSGSIGTVTFIGWSEDRTVGENLLYLGERTGATITTLGVSVVEGVVKFGEDLVDLVAITGTFLASGVVAVYDDISGTDRYYYDLMWEECRAFVSEDYVGSAFDTFYAETEFGQWMQEESYAFDSVRAIGVEVGEVIGTVTLATITGGSSAFIYGAAKAAEHTEENWQDPNKGTFEGLFQGFLEGAGDGVFFGLGATGDAVLKSVLGKSTLKNILALTGKIGYESACAVGQDGTNMVIDALFLDDQIVDESGNVLTFNSYKDKLNYCYEEAGGATGMLQSIGTAAILSFMSDGVDAAKAVRNVDVGDAVRNADINANEIDIEGKPTSSIDDSVSKVDVGYSKAELDQLNVNKSTKSAVDLDADITLKNTDTDTSKISTRDKNTTSVDDTISKVDVGYGKLEPDKFKIEQVSGKRNSKYLDGINEYGRQNFIDNIDKAVAEFGTSNFDNCANKLGITREELFDALDKKTRDIVQTSDFGIRITDDNLYSALKDGTFRNQFETGTSGGVLNTDSRLNLERELFNIPDSAPMSDRPVYGMLFPTLNKSDLSTINYYKDIYNGRSYGDTVVILKKENIIDDTTLTYGDSLAYKPNATEASNPQFNGGFSGFFKNIDSMDSLENAKLNDLTDGINAYAEIQLHGSVSHSTSNIDKVIFMKIPDKKIIKILKKYKIPYEIIS